MPRTPDTEISDDWSAAVTQPGYLIQIDTTPALRFSTRGTLAYDSSTWLGGADVLRVGSNPLSDGAQIRLSNDDNAVSALLLLGSLNDARARIWSIVGSAPTAAELVFDGVIDGAAEPIGGLSVTLDLAAASATASFQPAVVIGPPLCNHLMSAGSQITWGNSTITLEPSTG